MQKYADSLRDSVLTTFGEICGAELTFHEENNQPTSSDGIVGIISIVGDVAWTISMSFSKETAIALSMKFAGFEIPYDSADMGDVIGELVNVLAGDVVARLDEMGLRGEMSLPMVTRGSNMRIMPPEGTRISEMYFESSEGFFGLTLAQAQGQHS